MVKPSFGQTAARLGALSFSLTPVAAAVARTNNIDSMLVFTLLIAAWLLFKSINKNSVWRLFASFAVVGLAFNMKMLQAYMILPAFVLFFLLASKYKWKKKIALLSGAAVLMLAISVSWAVVVDSIPEDKRPYIGSSETNSVLELAFGYNGVSRLTGNQGPGKEKGSAEKSSFADKAASGKSQAPAFGEGMPSGSSGGNSVHGGPPGGQNSGGMFGTGTKGPLRLFQSELSGQASWLLPFAAIASISLLAGIRRKKISQKEKEVLFWLAWLIPGAIFFSIAGFFHHYYLIMLAPPIAALFGAGSAKLFEDYREGNGWKSWLLPAAVLITSIFSWYIIHPKDEVIGKGWSIAAAGAGILFTAILAVFKMNGVVLKRAALAGILVLFIGPAYWAATPIIYGGNSMIPQAGPTAGKGSFQGGKSGQEAMAAFGGMNGNGNGFPEGQDSGGTIEGFKPPGSGMGGASSSSRPSFTGRMPGNMGGGESMDKKTRSYLKKNNTGEKYLFATTSYQTAAPYIIDKGEKVITMGGFSGSDPVYTVDKLQKLVKSGQVKYFLISDRGGMRNGNSGSDITSWIKEHGTEVPSEKWQSSTANTGKTGNMGPGGAGTLYEVKL